MAATALDTVPRYLFGYVLLAGLRALGDRVWSGAAWSAVLDADKHAVDFLLLAVPAAIGLHLELRHVIGSSLRAVAVGGAAALWMATLTVAMIALAARGAPAEAALVGVGGLAVSFLIWRQAAAGEAARRVVERRFEAGQPVSLAEATQLLDHREPVDDAFARRVLRQLYPTIGELIPARDSPLVHGEGSRWATYWQGRSGWALVAVCREPGAVTPIHAHSHPLLAKTIEGSVEELRFREEDGAVVLVERAPLAHDELVETDGLATIHAIRNPGARLAIDLQLRGPEQGGPGRRLRTSVDLATLAVGARVPVTAEADDRPGHGGEGPAAGRWMTMS
jgi:hypothetical protein